MQHKLGTLAPQICFNKYNQIWYKYDNYYYTSHHILGIFSDLNYNHGSLVMSIK